MSAKQPVDVLCMRELKGHAIAEIDGQVRRIDPKQYKVKSQSVENEWYDILQTSLGFICNCPDHMYRAFKCKHIWAVEFSLTLRAAVWNTLHIQPVTVNDCMFCHSVNLKKFGVRKNKSGDLQRFLCGDCKRTFSINIGFERMKHNPQAITTAMQLYFSGESLRNTKNSLKLMGVIVSHQTVYNWIAKYVGLMQRYVEQLKPQMSDTWRADELWVKISGDMKYVFALMDDETRFWIAQEVADTKFTHDARNIFHKAKELAGSKPSTMITDGLPAYQDAFNKEFFTMKAPRSKHVYGIKFDSEKNNNKMERMNGEVRDREKVMRGLKVPDTPILTGCQIFHNFVRPHQALKGKTPADAAGIKVEGSNKWITLIQNATVHQPKVDNGAN